MNISIGHVNEQLAEKAKQLSDKLSLPIEPIKSACADFQLVYTVDKLELRYLLDQKIKPLCVDFLSNQLKHRVKSGGGKKQDLPRACGLHKNTDVSILDCTAGFGQDAYLLATFGASVLMLERSPIMAALLDDGLQRLSVQQELKLTLITEDSIQYLSNPSVPSFDVIYIDPMHPTREKSALTKIKMRLIREIVGEDNDALTLFNAALNVAKKRVVVKWPRLATSFTDRKPNMSYQGKTSRFDVYLIENRSTNSE